MPTQAERLTLAAAITAVMSEPAPPRSHHGIMLRAALRW